MEVPPTWIKKARNFQNMKYSVYKYRNNSIFYTSCNISHSWHAIYALEVINQQFRRWKQTEVWAAYITQRPVGIAVKRSFCNTARRPNGGKNNIVFNWLLDESAVHRTVRWENSATYLWRVCWCLVTHDNDKLRTTGRWKPTKPTDNPTSHKATTIQTLTKRAQLLCDSPDNLIDRTSHPDCVFQRNNYDRDFIKRNSHRNSEPTENTDDKSTDDPTPVITATLPYIRGTSETIARIIRPHNIRVAHKPITTLRDLLTNVKDKEQTHDRQGTDYIIPCSDCEATYIEETGRNLKTGLTEHKRATRKGQKTEHDIDWDSAECVIHSTNYYQRITPESCYTNLEREPLNRCQQLPAPCKRLIDDIKRNRTNNRRIERTTEQQLANNETRPSLPDQSIHDKTNQSRPRPWPLT